LSRPGAAVTLADINEDAVGAAADELTTAGHRALAVACDVSDEAQVAALVDRTVETFGRLDMAFNNAGIMLRCPTRPTSRSRTSTASPRSTSAASGRA
jgi:NAD(P)-dependent dehydrogenase (short-subunit alcohol dehydrogenase family)